MELQTQRLRLRSFREADFADFYQLYQEPETCRYLLHEPYDPSKATQQLQKKITQTRLTIESPLSLAVVYHGQVIGDISASYSEIRHTVEIGYAFSKASHGRGLATEAVKAVIAELFNFYDLHWIKAILDARNRGSAKLCERVGMRKEAHFIQDYWSKGEWTDSLVYAILRSEVFRGR